MADHARAFANGFIEAIASGKFDCINHRYYKGAWHPYSIYVLAKFIKTFYTAYAICADSCGVYIFIMPMHSYSAFLSN